MTPAEDALSAEIDALDWRQYAEVRITVRLPGSFTESGEPEKYGYSLSMLPEELRMENYPHVLPRELERIARLLVMSLRFR